MNYKSLLKLACLAVLPVALAVDCTDVKNLDHKDCKSDILVVTTMEKADKDYGYESVVETIKRFNIPAMQLSVPNSGISDEKIDEYLYTTGATKLGRFKVIVFPNGRVSYDNGGDMWQSAIKSTQWDKFYEYARSTDSKLVFLNEYPSNHTSTALYGEEATLDDAKRKYQLEQVIIPAEGINEEQAIREAQVNTKEIWHFPARIDEQYASQGITADPLLYFGPAEPDFPEQTVAAVDVNNNGARYAGFFMGFGDWSATSNALNVVWLTWALEKDFQFISGDQLTSQDAIKLASGAGRSTTVEVAFVTLATIFTIFVTLF